MSYEEKLVTLLGPLFDGEIYPDTTPAIKPEKFAVFNAVGGKDRFYINGGVPGTSNVRVQINVWAKTRDEATALIKAVRLTLANQVSVFESVAPYGQYSSTIIDEPDEHRGAVQDFSIWYRED